MESESVATASPHAWTVSGPAPREMQIELTFAVKQNGLQELHDTLMRVSSPSSPDYGKHLSNEQVQAMTAPAGEHIDAVRTMLFKHNVKTFTSTSNNDMIIATVPVEIAESMLSTMYFQVRHSKSGVEVSRALDGYKLPSHIAA